MPHFGMPLEKSQNFKGSSLRLLAVVRRDGSVYAGVVLLAVVSVGLGVLGPKALGNATDVIFRGLQRGGPSHIDFHQLHTKLEVVLGLYLASSALQYLNAYLLTGVVQRTMRRLRSDIEEKLHRLPLGYVDGQRRGDLLSRVTNDTDNLQMSLQQTLSQMLTSTLMVVGTVVMMFVICGPLALITIALLPATGLILRAITKRSRPRFIAQWRYTGELNGLVEETFTGHAIVKAFGRQDEVEGRFRTLNDELCNASFGAQSVSGATNPLMMFIGNLTFIVVCVVGGLRVASGKLSLGGVQAFIQYSRQLAQPITQIAAMVNLFQSGIASAERIFAFLDAPEEIPDPVDAAVAPDVQGRITFEDVAFSYDAKRPLITDLSLVVEPGQTVAIVGPTGAGKTTLVNLIMRFYEIDGGRITLDGIDTRTMTRAELRSKVGMVLQDTWVFHGTIRENIAYGRPGATDEEVRAAAKTVHFDHFVQALSAGYDTVIDDDENVLSAGEKQLLTIARAFLADPSILILDEATSSVDTRTEVLIQKAMAVLRANRTSFVIAHRLSTIRDADTILVMDEGAIVEQGSHEDLLARDGRYARLYWDQAEAASSA
ncbi:MAG TPA: ABC transporter ATP-binding protein [Mycobacteriales bacterium]|nr:ABC transporter ATP-binding protein [Mycobacteriales bacterium]